MNTTDSAVRITHIPTGLVVSQQDQKSQLQNKLKAMEVLRARLLDLRVAEQEAARSKMRKSQVGTGDRSAKIRTYNYPQSRITDHRIGFTTHELSGVMDGHIEPLIEALQAGGRRGAARWLTWRGDAARATQAGTVGALVAAMAEVLASGRVADDALREARELLAALHDMPRHWPTAERRRRVTRGRAASSRAARRRAARRAARRSQYAAGRAASATSRSTSTSAC